MKTIVAMVCASVLLVGTTFATGNSETKLYKLTSSLSGYAGDVESGLPKTAYLTADDSGNAYILWYWTKEGNKYMSEPFEVSTDNDGYENELFFWDHYLYQDAQSTRRLTANEPQTAYGELYMAGASPRGGYLPNTLSGSYYNEAYDWDVEEYLGFGLGTCSATCYKTLTNVPVPGIIDNYAYDAMMSIAAKLQQNGYKIPQDGTAIYQQED